MKRILRTITTFVFALLLSFNAKAQLDLGLLLEAGANDASKYLEGYMSPLFRGLGFGMNGGWYQTAKPHQTLGFDLSVSLMSSQVPAADEFFTFNNSEFDNFYFAGGNSVQVPTMFGPNLGADDLPQLTVRDFSDEDGDGDTMEELIRLSAPTGLGLQEGDLGDILPFNAVPVPMVQLGVGVIKGTDVKLRFIPEQDFDDATLSLMGVGLLHDITQWLPGEDIFPVSLSVFAGITQLNTEIFLNDEKTQSMALEANSFMGQVIASKKFLFVTPYVGLGYASANSNVTLKGTFETENSTLTDPVDFDVQTSGFRANAGLTLELAVIRINAEYAFQEYNTLTVGFGISIR